MKRSIFILLCTCLAASCRVTGPEPVDNDGRALRIECDDYDQTAKSAGFTEEVTGSISNVNIFVYDASGLLINSPDKGDLESYFVQPRNIDIRKLFPRTDAHYSVYAIANVGRINPSLVSTRAGADNFSFTYSDYSEIEESGFPKAAVIDDFCPESSPLRIKVKRLLSRFHINIINDSPYAFDLGRVNVRQSARNLYPFKSGSSADECFSTEGDSFTSFEVGNQEGVIYVLENVRGPVFPSGCSSSDRTIDNLSASNRDLCTYLEFGGRLIDVDGGLYENAVFRYFFGNGQYAGVERNKNVELDLRLSQTCVESDGWRRDLGEYKYIRPKYKTLTFSWRGTDTFICPLFSENFTGVQDLTPTGSSPFTMTVDASLGWTVSSFPDWMSVEKSGASIRCLADYLPFGSNRREGEIVLESIDGSVTGKVRVSQTPPASWMRFPLPAYCFQDLRSSGTGGITINIYYDSSVKTGGFTVKNIYAVTGVFPGSEDFMMKSLTSGISISYGTAFTSPNSLLKYRIPVTVSIPGNVVNSLRNSAGANGCILYFDFDNSSKGLYSDPKVLEDNKGSFVPVFAGIASGLPRLVLRLY